MYSIGFPNPTIKSLYPFDEESEEDHKGEAELKHKKVKADEAGVVQESDAAIPDQEFSSETPKKKARIIKVTPNASSVVVSHDGKEESLVSQFNFFHRLPKDVVNLILFKCSYRDLLALEIVCQGYRALTDRNWQILTVKNRFNYAWELTRPDGQPQAASARDQYRLGKALHMYMRFREEVLKNRKKDRPTQVTRIAGQLDGIIVQFPAFGEFVTSDLKHLVPVGSRQAGNFRGNNLATLQKPSNAAGNLMLQNLLKFNGQFKLSKTFPACFLEPIRAFATCASLYAIQMGLRLRKKAGIIFSL